MFVLAIVGRGAMGMGDVKVGCFAGCALGLTNGFLSLLFGFAAGGLFALVVLVLRLRHGKDVVPLTPFIAGGFEVTPMELPHYQELTFGLRVTNGKATVAYSGDTAPTPRLAELARDADVFLCEATLAQSEPPEERGHLSADEAVEAFEASGARRLVVIHRPDELPLDPGVERARDWLELEL